MRAIEAREMVADREAQLLAGRHIRPGDRLQPFDQRHALRFDDRQQDFRAIEKTVVQRFARHADLHVRTCRIGHLLELSGIGAGDRVMFSVRDGLDFAAIFLAVMKVGAVALPINTFLKARDYAYYLTDSGAVAVVVDAGLAPTFRDILSAAPAVRHAFVANGDAAGFRSLDAALAGLPETLDTLPRAPGDPAFWLYSSGSAGDPKGVVHMHEHIYWATELFGLRAQGVTRDDVIQCPRR